MSARHCNVLNYRDLSIIKQEGIPPMERGKPSLSYFTDARSLLTRSFCKYHMVEARIFPSFKSLAKQIRLYCLQKPFKVGTSQVTILG